MPAPDSLPTPTLHASVVARRLSGHGWRGVLLSGPSGAGKSGLAVRLIVEHGWRLVADDRVVAWASGGRAFARAPGTLAGMIELRTIGVLAAPALPWAELALTVECAARADALERIPMPAWAHVADVRLPRLALDARAADAPAKLEFALKSAVGRSGGRPL